MPCDFIFSRSCSLGQSKVIAQKILQADSSQSGKPFSKNPYVIRFKGGYLMCSSVLPGNDIQAREIEITESYDLIN
jgi:hypothetical protein